MRKTAFPQRLLLPNDLTSTIQDNYAFIRYNVGEDNLIFPADAPGGCKMIVFICSHRHHTDALLYCLHSFKKKERLLFIFVTKFISYRRSPPFVSLSPFILYIDIFLRKTRINCPSQCPFLVRLSSAKINPERSQIFSFFNWRFRL